MLYKMVCLFLCTTILVGCSGSIPSEGKALLDTHLVDSCKIYAECKEADVKIKSVPLTEQDKANGLAGKWCAKYTRLIKFMANREWTTDTDNVGIATTNDGRWVIIGVGYWECPE